MIPKIIYTCWLSDVNTIPEYIRYYIHTLLRTHPYYKHILIDSDSYHQLESILPDWVQSAYERGIYSHVSDFLRVYFLYNYGGIYMDSDVECLKYENIFDKYLNYEFVSNIENCVECYLPDIRHISKGSLFHPIKINEYNTKEGEFVSKFKYGISIDGAMMLAEPGCALLSNALNIYYSDDFKNYTNDTLFNTENLYPNICNILSLAAEPFGFNYDYEMNKTYTLNNGKYILFTDRFIDIYKFYNEMEFKGLLNDNTELLHRVKGSWKSKKIKI